MTGSSNHSPREEATPEGVASTASRASFPPPIPDREFEQRFPRWVWVAVIAVAIAVMVVGAVVAQ